MAAFTDEKEAKMIEDLAVDAEMLIDKDDERKDLKEKRAFIKQTFYNGSQKMKHMIPKGKRL